VNKFARRIGGLLLALWALPALAQIPSFKTTPTLSASSESITAWGELIGGEYYIKDSQVGIVDLNKGTGPSVYLGSIFFGILGAAVGTAIDISIGVNKVSSDPGVFLAKFHDELGKAFSRHLALTPGNAVALIVAPDSPANVSIRPAVRLVVHEDGLTRMTVRLLARFKASENSSVFQREYLWSPPVNKALVGQSESWAAEDGKLFREQVTLGLGLLTDIIVRDMSGEFRWPEKSEEQRQITAKIPVAKRPGQFGVLAEREDYYIVHPMLFATRPSLRFIFLLAKNGIEIRGVDTK
jgi:hypothetical protein